MKKIIQVVMLLCSLFVMSLTCSAAYPSVVDQARLLNVNDKNAVTATINQVEKKYNVRTAVLTIRDSKVTDLGTYANNYLNRNYKDGINGNMVLVVNMANSKFYVSTDNKMRTKISDSYGVKDIGNSAANMLKNRKYKEAFQAYAIAADKHLAYYAANKKAMAPAPAAPVAAKAPAEKKKGGNMPMAAGGAVLVGAIAAFVYGGSLKASMSNVAAAVQADQYMKEGSFRVTEQEDNFLYFTYTRVKKAKPQAQENHVDDADDASDDNNGGAGGGF